MNAHDLMAELRLTSDGDDWGNMMGWWFAVAAEMYERGIGPPDEWRYRPSPLGAKDPDAYETEFCEQADDNALHLFGRALHRYAGMLKKAGKDY